MPFDITPSETVLKYAPWSLSKANTAKDCPRKFYFNYVVKKKGVTNADALVGQATHSALEFALEGRPPLRAIEFAMEKYPLTTNEQERVMAFQPAIENFLRSFKHYCTQHHAQPPQYEQKLAVDINGKAVANFFDNKKVFLRGVLDIAVLFKRKPYALVLDHKTGKDRGLHYYAQQFLIYRILMKAQYPNLTKILSGINWVKADRIDLGDFVDTPNIEGPMAAFIEFLNESTKDLGDLSEYRQNRLCDWCDYKSQCPMFNPKASADVIETEEDERTDLPTT